METVVPLTFDLYTFFLYGIVHFLQIMLPLGAFIICVAFADLAFHNPEKSSHGGLAHEITYQTVHWQESPGTNNGKLDLQSQAPRKAELCRCTFSSLLGPRVFLFLSLNLSDLCERYGIDFSQRCASIDLAVQKLRSI